MKPHSPVLAVFYCEQFATRIQLRNAAGSHNSLRLQFLSREDTFWQCLTDELPQWVLLTSHCLQPAKGLATAIRQQCPTARVILCVLPDAPTSGILWPLIEQAEVDVLCTLAELSACLAAAAVGHYFSSAMLATNALAPLANVAKEVSRMWQPLTAAEQRVMRGLLRGDCRQTIAATLFLSPRTVDNHKAHIAEKLNVSGGPYSLNRFILLHKDELTAMLLDSPNNK